MTSAVLSELLPTFRKKAVLHLQDQAELCQSKETLIIITTTTTTTTTITIIIIIVVVVVFIIIIIIIIIIRQSLQKLIQDDQKVSVHMMIVV
jgi:hypothetical protein